MPFIPTTRGFKMASLNITSLLKHFDELKVFVSNNPIDVLAINETRLYFSITDCEVFIPGYEIFPEIVILTEDMAEEYAFTYKIM